MREYIPLIKQNAAYQPKYYMSSIRHQINIIRSLKKKYRKFPTNTNLAHLNNAEKLLANLISSAKSEYENNLINNFAFKTNPKYINIYEISRNLLQYQTQSTLARLMLLMMSTKPYYLTSFSSQSFLLETSCQQTTMLV